MVAGLGVATIAAGGFKAAIDFGVDSSRVASEVEEMSSKFEVVFGDSTEKARQSLARFGDEVGRSELKLMGMASTLQDTFVPMGFARDQASELSVKLVKLATDVASFSNAQDVDVLQDFQSALVGQSETVRKYGIVITEARVKQVAYQNGIADVGKEITEQQKLQARMAILFSDTSDAQGDAARTAGSLANVNRALSDSVYELKAAIGEGINIKIVGPKKSAIPVIEAITDEVKLGILFDKLKAAGAMDDWDELKFGIIRPFDKKNTTEVIKELTDKYSGLLEAEEMTQQEAFKIRDTFEQVAKTPFVSRAAVEDAKILTEYTSDLSYTVRATGEEFTFTSRAAAQYAMRLVESGTAAEDAAKAGEAFALKLGDINQGARDAIQGLRDLKAQNIEDFFDVDISPEDVAKQLFDVTAFKAAGGEASNSLIGSVKAALAEGKITSDQAKEFFRNIAIESQAIKINLKQTDLKEAAETISKDFNVPLGEAYKLLKQAKSGVDLVNEADVSALTSQFDALQERKNMLIEAGELPIEVDQGDLATARIAAIQDNMTKLTDKDWLIKIFVNMQADPAVRRLIGEGVQGSQGGKGSGGGSNAKLMASGGPMVAGNPYWVGEHGPEPFFPAVDGRMLSNEEARQAMAQGEQGSPGGPPGGDTYNYYVYNPAAMALANNEARRIQRRRLNASMGVR